MVRSNYYVNPSEKKIEIFSDFTGGLNTVTTNDNLSDRELTFLENADLDSRGAITRRLGMHSHITPPVNGIGQGYFRYYKNDGTYEEIVAINGKLYKNGVELPITGMTDFQKTRKVEAVQFRDKLYIATGTYLVYYDGGATAKLTQAYKPVGQEALYIGYNALAPDPINYTEDSINTFNSIDTVLFSTRYGVVNKPFTTTIIVTKISGDILEYKTEVMLPNTSTWVVLQDFSPIVGGKTVSYTPTTIGDYAYRFTIRKQGTTGQDIVYNIPKYSVKQTEDTTTLDTSFIHSCNRIFTHNDRLCLYGDTGKPNQLYFSHLNNPTYFPMNNTVDFKSDRQEGLTAIVKYRNLLVAFTPSNIQALYGSSPLDFVKKVINSSIGCSAPYSATVVENAVYFVSKEGVYALVSTGAVDDRMNVRRLDERIWNALPTSNDCVGTYFDKQYHLVYPTDKVRFRFYTQMGVWTKDKSENMNLSNLTEWDGLLYGQKKDNGQVVYFDPRNTGVVTDLGEVYKFIVETKFFDFGAPYHPKVLKQLQLLMKVQHIASSFRVYIYSDSNIVVNPDHTDIGIDESGNITWTAVSEDNEDVDAGTVLGSWIMGKSAFGTLDSLVNRVKLSGKCRRTKLKMVQEENLPCSFLGLAYQFKLRKPK